MKCWYPSAHSSSYTDACRRRAYLASSPPPYPPDADSLAAFSSSSLAGQGTVVVKTRLSFTHRLVMYSSIATKTMLTKPAGGGQRPRGRGRAGGTGRLT